MKKRKVEKEKAFDYAKFEQEAIQGLTEGKGLIGEHGVLTGMIGRLLSAAFEGEMDAHLDQEKKRSNRRNGYTDKTVRRHWVPFRSGLRETATAVLSRRSSRSGTGRWPPNWRTRSCICTARAPATRTLGTI